MRKPLPALLSDTALLLYLALFKLLLHLYTNLFAGYGIFRDELYYLACAGHLSGGYVDQPPLSIFILAANRLLFGESVFALRLLPAVTGALTVFLTGLIARQLGGGRFAQIASACASMVSLILLAFNAVYSMNCFDILFWTLAAYALIRLIKSGDPKYWPRLGLILGFGLLNKVGVLWLGFGIFTGLLLTPERRWLRTRWPYVACGIAIVVFLPYVIWNLTHGLAHLEFIRNATSGKYSHLTALSFALGQIIIQNPFTLPLWLSGLVFLSYSLEKRFRILAYVYLAAFAILVVNGHSKPEYLGAAYPMLFAAGGTALERWLKGRWRWAREAYVGLMLAGGAIAAPFVLPILPVESYIRYSQAMGVKPSTSEAKKLDKLPQFYADMFGWEEKARAVAQVFHSLTSEDQAKCAIFADNYGRCGAIDFYSRKYGLPKSIGRHNNYWIWGPRDYTGELMLILGGDLEDKRKSFESVEVAGTVTCEYCMPYENNLRIYVCRKLKKPLADRWPKLKDFS